MNRAIKLIVDNSNMTPDLARGLVDRCPFAALDYKSGALALNSNCRLCGLCVKTDAYGALKMLYDDEPVARADDDLNADDNFNGIAVFAETDCASRVGDNGGGGASVAPVSFELLGKALDLAGPDAKVSAAPGADAKISVVAIGRSLDAAAQKLARHGASAVYLYDSPELGVFEARRYTACLCDFIARVRPSALLVGATDLGRSLAPRAAAAFRTGLTADCTGLDINADGLLVQTRPAFGGNIMAQILTRRTRPQICTVRYRVFDAPPERDPTCEIVRMPIPPFGATGAEILRATRRPKVADISEAERIVAVGRGARDEKGLALCRELADILGAQLACSRPLAEEGVFEQRRQIGLSGRMVKPKLLIAVGVSGAVQFTTAMRDAEQIIAINPDKSAPIFSVAHLGLVGSAHEILPEIIKKLSSAL